MKKIFLGLVLSVLFVSNLYAADAKVSALPELAATPDGGDLLMIVDDPGGSPVSKKITVTNLMGATHAAVTLSVSGDTLLSLSTQAIGLDTQTANYVFAGPTTGIPATPTFRTLVTADVPTLNQSTTGSAATLTTPRAIYGNNFNGSAALTQTISSAYGGTGNAYTKFTGPTTAEKTFTLPDASSTLLYSGGALGTPSAGTLTNCTFPTLNQNTTGSAALATEVTATANNSTNETVYPLFVDGATGSQGAETDTGWTYNPSTGNMTISGVLTSAGTSIAATATGGQYGYFLEDTDNGTNYAGFGVYGNLAASTIFAYPLAAPSAQVMSFAAPGNQTMGDGTTKSVSVGTWVTPLVSANIDTFAELDTIVADKVLVNTTDGAVWTGVHDFGGATSFEIPNSDASPSVAGQLRYDTTVIGLTNGSLAYYGGNLRYLVDLDTLPSNDDYVIAYDADADKFYMKADAGSGAAGTMTTVKEADSQVGGADIVTLDFGAGFDLAESPDTEIQISLDVTEFDASASDINTGTSTTTVVTPDALAGSNAFTKSVCFVVVESDTVTAVADGKQAFVVPASMNGMNLIDVTASIADLNSASGGTTTVVIRRVRGATAANMTSTGVTVAYNEYTASDETVNTSNDDLATGDKIYVDTNAVTTGAVQKGLSVTASFQLP